MSACCSEISPCCRAFALTVLQAVSEALPDVAERIGPDLQTWIDGASRAGGASAGCTPTTLALHGCSLQFEHACRHSACADPACQLCKNNPHKTCATQLRPKYVVGQEVAAPCGAPTTVTLGVGGSGGSGGTAARQWAALAAQGARLQVLLVDERARQQRAKELLLTGASSASSRQVATLLRESVVAFDPAGKPMLSCSDAEAAKDGSLLLDLQADGGVGVALAGLSVGCSTERATAGRKRAPVRLAALLVDAEGEPLDVAPVLSPEFYVVSDRSENHEGMGGILLKDSPVAQVRSIGKETVRRLLDIPAACGLVGVGLELPDGLTSVTTVGQLAQLLEATKDHAADLSQVLKLSKAQLETAAAHVATAVEPDAWLRLYLSPSGAGLLYASQQGGCMLAEPIAALECRRDESGSLLPLALQRLSPNAPELRKRGSALQQLLEQAEAAWRMPGHPGWEVLRLGGTPFESFEDLQRALPADLVQPVLPRLAHLAAAAPAHAQPAAAARVQPAHPQQQQPLQPPSGKQLLSRQRDKRPRGWQQQQRQGERQKEQWAAVQGDPSQQALRPQQWERQLTAQQLPQQQQANGHERQLMQVAALPQLQPAGRAGGTLSTAPGQPSAARASLSQPAANPFAVAASAASSGSGSKRPQHSGGSGLLSPSVQQGSAFKRPKLTEAGATQDGSGTVPQAERPSLESNNSQQGPLFALPTPQQPVALQQPWAAQLPQPPQQQQQAPWPLAPWQQPQQQQASRLSSAAAQQQASRPTKPMPSVPRPPTSARAVNEQQQANLLVDLLRKLSKEQAQAGAAGLVAGAGPSPNAAVSWDWLASLGALAAAPPAQAAAPPTAAAPTFAAAATVPPPAHPLASLGLAPSVPLASLGFTMSQPLIGSGLLAAHPEVGHQLMEQLGSLGLGLDAATSIDLWTKSLEAVAQLLSADNEGQGAARQQPFPPGSR